MIVSRLTRLTAWNSLHFMTCLQKHQKLHEKVVQSRNVSKTNVQVVRRFAEKIQSTQSCWKCETSDAKNSVICEKCGSLLSPNTKRNYFELLGVSETFDVNNTKLTEKFRQFQSVVHPDKFSNK